MQHRVFVWSVVPDILPALKKHVAKVCPAVLPRITWTQGTSKSFAEVDLAAADIVVADPPDFAPFVAKAKALQWCQSTFAGVNDLFSKSTRRDYRLTRCSVFGPMMAEYALTWAINVERRNMELFAAQRRKEWSTGVGHRYQSMQGRTMAVLGAGEIGQHVLRLASAFGMRTVAFRASGKAIEGVDTVTTDVGQALERADVVVSVLPSTPATAGMLNGDVLKRCQLSPTFINMGRGDLIDEATILRALDSNWISAAVLDVYAQEPVPDSSPLYTHPQVYMTPHVAGVTDADDMAGVFARNLALWTGAGDAGEADSSAAGAGAGADAGAGARAGAAPSAGAHATAGGSTATAGAVPAGGLICEVDWAHGY